MSRSFPKNCIVACHKNTRRDNVTESLCDILLTLAALWGLLSILMNDLHSSISHGINKECVVDVCVCVCVK